MLRQFVRAVLLTEGLFLLAATSHAQYSLDLPRASPQARVMQRVGLTQITINYSRPSVKGRKIWGGLEAYGKVWRAGADENTTFEVSDPVNVEGKPLAKGGYGLHMIPGEGEWTVIFSKNSTSWGSYTYDPAEDALRISVKPQPAEHHEELTYDFLKLTPESTTVTLFWEKVAVPFKVDVKVNDVVQQSLRNQLRNSPKWTWEGWNQAANYLLSHKLALTDALRYSDESIQLEERFENLMTKARVLDALEKKDDANALRKQALSVGSATQLHSFGRQLQTQGQQDQAFEIFRTNIKKNPNHWLVHSEIARLACAQSRFDDAVKEMKLAVAGAPSQFKPTMEGLVQRLQKKEDINK